MMSRPLNKREQKKLVRKANEAKNRKLVTLFYTVLFASFILSLYSYTQYYWTIIDYKIPLLIFIVSGLLLASYIKKYFEDALTSHMVKIHTFWFIFSIGSVCTSFAFFLNNVMAKSEVYSIKASIIDCYITRGKRGRKNVNAEVKLKDFTKDLLFPIEDQENAYGSNFVLLDVSKGGLGFEIIRDRTLIK